MNNYTVAVEEVGTVGDFSSLYDAARECRDRGWGAYVVIDDSRSGEGRRTVAYATENSTEKSVHATVRALPHERETIEAVPTMNR